MCILQRRQLALGDVRSLAHGYVALNCKGAFEPFLQRLSAYPLAPWNAHSNTKVIQNPGEGLEYLICRVMWRCPVFAVGNIPMGQCCIWQEGSWFGKDKHRCL